MSGGSIVAVEPAGTRHIDLDLGNVAVLPGFVNAHTHLDLTGLRGLAPPRLPLPDWLRLVIAHRRTRSPEQVEADVRAGLAECVRTGTTLVGDISGDGGSWKVLADCGIRAVVFRELLGLPRDRAHAAEVTARAWLEEHPPTTTCRPGLSPHAPYSVRGELLSRAATLAREHGTPLAIHLAETAEELELVQHRRGAFVAFLQDLGVWAPDGPVGSLEEVLYTGVGRGSVSRLLVHGNYLPPDTVLDPGDSIVYCPRTHAAFGHPSHPFREFLRRGNRVALGTDSLASNPDLDLLEEVRFLRRTCADVPGEVLLRMATLAGAEALGWAEVTGSLEAGKSADLVVVPLAGCEEDDPYERVLSGRAPVRRVLFRGVWLTP